MAVACFYFYTRFRRTLRYLALRHPDGPSAVFAEVSSRTKQFLRRVGKRASNVDWLEGLQEQIERIFSAVLDTCRPAENERRAFHELYKLDLFCLLIRTAPAREQQFERVRQLCAGVTAHAPEPVDSARALRASYGKELSLAFTLDQLMRLHELHDGISPSPQRVYVHAPYEHWEESVVPLSDMQRTLIETISADRPRRVKSIVAAASRMAKQRHVGEEMVRDALTALIRERIVAVGPEGRGR
jgi:hypothetical protein